MKVILKSVKIIHPEGNVEDELKDILIEDGVIKKIASSIKVPADGEIIDEPGSYVSIGWFDMKANFRDPGDEVKEGLKAGLNAALAGGFTGVLLMPSTNPPIQNKADVEYLRNRANGHLVSIYPAGVLSIGREGKDISEMFDMKNAGAVAFTDDRRPVSDSGLLLRALQYSKNIDSLVISYADDKSISGKGLVNEGVSSTMAGMKGMPDFAEELMVNRDLKICEYTGGKLHFSTLSTTAAVEMVRAAKKQGLPVTAEVSAHQLFFDDTVILGYDTNYKVKPPFRGKKDIKSLIKGLADGTIDVICSDHIPEDPESKVVEFDFASFGISGIETAFAAVNTTAGSKIGLERMIDAMTVKPRKILGIDVPEIKEGAKANLTIFNPNTKWIPLASQLKTKSKNNPFVGIELTGRPIAVINNGLFGFC